MEETLLQTMMIVTDARALHETLKSREQELRSLVCDEADGGLSQLDVVLARLESPLHTVAVVHAFTAFVNSLTSADLVVGVCSRLSSWLATKASPEQLRLVPRTVATLAHRLASVAGPSAKAAIEPLRTLVILVADADCSLTPAHAEVLQCCLDAKCYRAAANFVAERPVGRVSPTTTALTSSDMLRYHYYAGLAYTGLKQWAEAASMFRIAVTMPAASLSAIAVAAFKKLVLVELLRAPSRSRVQQPEAKSETLGGGTNKKDAEEQTRATQLPKYTPMVVTRHIRQCSSAYCDLAGAFEAGDPAKLAELLKVHAEVLTRDGNAGLAAQLPRALQRRCLGNLTQTYSNLSLARVAEATGLPDAAAACSLVLSMVAAGEIDAKIDEPAAMVDFLEPASSHTAAEEAEMMALLHEEIQRALTLGEVVEAVSERLATNPQYVLKSNAADCPDSETNSIAAMDYV